jgi:hypothetical protein
MAGSLDVRFPEEEVGTPTVLHFVRPESCETQPAATPGFPVSLDRAVGHLEVEVKFGRAPAEFARRLLKDLSLAEKPERERVGMGPLVKKRLKPPALSLFMIWDGTRR